MSRLAEELNITRLMALTLSERERLMSSEAERLLSFGTLLWTATDIVPPAQLAAAGLYYTGVQDRVQCAFCRGVLRNWEHGDSPMAEHRKFFPQCPLVAGRECGNVPVSNFSVLTSRESSLLTPKAGTTGSTNQFSVTLSGSGAAGSDKANPAETSAAMVMPRSPQFAVLASRLKTYAAWPASAQQTPQRLAEAGFFYTGTGDNVRCFHCNGALRSFEASDEPWAEHEKWFAACPYVAQHKSEALASGSGRNQGSASSSVVAHARGISPLAGVTLTADELLRESSVKAAMDGGYDLDLIHNILNTNFTACLASRCFPSATELIDALIKNESNTRLAANKTSITSQSSGITPVSSNTQVGRTAQSSAITPADGASQAHVNVQSGSGTIPAGSTSQASVTASGCGASQASVIASGCGMSQAPANHVITGLSRAAQTDMEITLDTLRLIPSVKSVQLLGYHLNFIRMILRKRFPGCLHIGGLQFPSSEDLLDAVHVEEDSQAVASGQADVLGSMASDESDGRQNRVGTSTFSEARDFADS